MDVLIKRPYFKRIYLCITPILVSILIFFAMGIYWQEIENQKRIEVKEYGKEAGQIVLQVDDRFEKIYELTGGLMNREWVKRLYSHSDAMREYFDYTHNVEIYQEMGIYNGWVGFTKTVAVLDMNQGRLVDKDGWQEYDSFCRRIGITSREKQKELLECMEESDGLLTVIAPGWEDNFGNELCFMAREIGKTPSSCCYFLAVFDQNSFWTYLNSLNSDIVAFSIVEEGQSLFSFEEEAGGSAVCFDSDAQLGWEYQVALKNSIDSGMSRKLCWLLGIVLFMAGVGALISFWLTYVLYHPMMALMKNLHLSGEKDQDEYSMILSHVELLNKEREEAKREAQQYFRIAKNVLLQKILFGYFDRKKSEKEQKKYQLQLSDEKWYQVVRLHVEQEEKALAVRKAAEDFLKLKKMSYEIAESFRNDIFVILIFDNMEEKMEKSELAEFMENLVTLTGIPISLIGGTCEKKVIGISKSYSNIQEVCAGEMESQGDGKTRVVDVKQKIYYPTDWEIQLITQLKYGNRNVVKGILSELDKENHGRNLSAEESQKIIAIIFDTLIRVMAELDIGANDWVLAYHHNRRMQDDAGQWRILYEAADGICNGVLNRTEKVKISETVVNIKTYIDEHYNDPQLSIKQIGEVFRLSESSVSRLFKNQFGELFSDYLCRQRMEKAKVYFQTGRYTVKAVAGMVGYGNELSFSRAFQKYEGIRPSVFIELHGNENEAAEDKKKGDKKYENDDNR